MDQLRISEINRTPVNSFGNAFTDFLTNGKITAILPEFGRDLHEVATEWVHSNVQMLVSGVDSAEAIQDACAAIELSPVFLDAFLSSHDGVSERCAVLSPDVEFMQDPRLSRRLKDVAAALQLGGKPVLCPFTGKRALVRDSLDLHTFLYRHGRHACIMLPDWRIDQCASDRCWYFIEHNLILSSVPGLDGRAALVRTAARVMSNHELVSVYLADSSRPLMVSEDAMSHIGHYTWNITSGWSRLYSLVQPERIEVLTSYLGWQIFGGVTELYPEQAARVGCIVRPDSEEDLYDLVLQRRALSLVLLDDYITAEAAQCIINLSGQRCSSQFHAGIIELRRSSYPLIMLTIRTENRAWIEQQEGYASLINKLALTYPRLGIILDGINSGMVQIASHGLMSLKDEQVIAANIVEDCPTVRIYNSLGCQPHESVVLAEAIDAFLAPIGAGLTKTRWIANKPGVAFSNQTFMQPGNCDLYDRFRDGLTPTRYVDVANLTDVEDSRHGEKSRANFSMPWQAAYESLRALLLTLIEPEATQDIAKAS